VEAEGNRAISNVGSVLVAVVDDTTKSRINLDKLLKPFGACFYLSKKEKAPRDGYGTGCLLLSFEVLFVLKKSLFCLLLLVVFCVRLWRLL